MMGDECLSTPPRWESDVELKKKKVRESGEGQ